MNILILNGSPIRQQYRPIRMLLSAIWELEIWESLQHPAARINQREKLAEIYELAREVS